MIPRGLLILGFGGHARSVADVALDPGRIRVADHVTIGAGSTVIHDVTEPGIHVGSPARRVKGKDLLRR